MDVAELGYAPQVTPKVDIYSFGVVLLNLLTGKRPVDPSFGESHHITSWVLSIIRQNGLTANDELLDSRLLSMATELQKIQMIHVLKVAISCTKYAPLERLTMAEVVEALRITRFL
jgi:serine/threonine protein kinase